jgi:carboxymethylenebutenolidase
LTPLVNSKPDAELLSDLDSTVAWAKSQGGATGRLGIVGFCRGGRTVWEYAAHSGALKAGVRSTAHRSIRRIRLGRRARSSLPLR